MKATKEDACKLVSKYFGLAAKGKQINYAMGQFHAYEMIAKGNAMLDVITRPALNKNQKKELIKLIKEL